MKTFYLPFVFYIGIFSLPHASAEADQKPNFLIIVIDDLNDYVGCLDGHPNASTPNLDRLAKQGTLFTHAYCNSPVCNPSRTSLWTGLRPSTTGITTNQSGWFREILVLRDIVSLPQALAGDGYATAGFGKLFNHLQDDLEWQQFSPYNYGPLLDPKLNYPHGDRLTDWGVPPNGKASYDEEIAQLTIAMLGKPQTSPFLIGCGFYRPHTPIYAQQQWFDKHPIDAIELPPGYLHGDNDDLVYFGKRARKLKDVEAPGLFDQAYVEKEGVWRAIIQAYLASTSEMDYQLGKVVKALEESDYSKNTYVFCFSDHGWDLGEKEHWGKAALWEHTTRVPFIIMGPGIPSGQVCDQPVGLLDVYPTVLELAQTKPPHPLEGVSLMPLLKNPKIEWTRPVLTTFSDHHSLRTQRWRYIRYATGEEELYDHGNDPYEWTNLASSESPKQEVASALKKLRNQLNELLKQ